MTKRILPAFTFICAALSLAPCRGAVDAEFRAALKRGADYRTVLKVVDDSGVSVEGASVRATIEQLHKIYTVRGTTDTNGLFTISGRTTGNRIVIDVTKDGYYGSRREHCLIAMGAEHEVRDGRWQPYGAEEELFLRRIENPIRSASGYALDFRYTRKLREWVGFDLQVNDFVKPSGRGEVSDMEVFFDWDGKWLPEYSGMGVKIRFPPPSGYYTEAARNESEFTGPYAVKGDAFPFHDAEFSERIQEDGSRKQVHFDPSRCWVVRSRCRVDESGKLVSANYSVVLDIRFTCDRGGLAGLLVRGFSNPTPNDTNLEAKR